MKYAFENEISVTPRGAGTGMTGGSIPLNGSMVLSLEKMNKLVELDTNNLNVVVEPGIINGRLQRDLEHLGFFYPPDPASMNFCTIGGNAANNAGGPRALKYGVTKDYVMEIEAVLPDGSVITTGVKTAKGVVGYDLTRLLTGSEGTLAVITKLCLRILPLPEEVITLLAMFDNLEASGSAVAKITASKIIPRTLEFMDAGTIVAVENFKPVGIPRNVEALLLIISSREAISSICPLNCCFPASQIPCSYFHPVLLSCLSRMPLSCSMLSGLSSPMPAAT